MVVKVVEEERAVEEVMVVAVDSVAPEGRPVEMGEPGRRLTLGHSNNSLRMLQKCP